MATTKKATNLELGYAAYMSEKEATEKAAFGPRPSKVAREWYETKWRTQPELHEKIAAAAKVEEFQAEIKSGVRGKISVNAQLNFIAEMFMKTYEEKFGPLPSPKDIAALKRYAAAKMKK
jgi:hypothetical protein